MGTNFHLLIDMKSIQFSTFFQQMHMVVWHIERVGKKSEKYRYSYFPGMWETLAGIFLKISELKLELYSSIG